MSNVGRKRNDFIQEGIFRKVVRRSDVELKAMHPLHNSRDAMIVVDITQLAIDSIDEYGEASEIVVFYDQREGLAHITATTLNSLARPLKTS